jgi:serine/threonine protein kinase
MADPDPGRDRLEVLASDFLSRLRRGESPSISDYARENPDLAAEIEDLFPTVRAAEQIKQPHGQWLRGEEEEPAELEETHELELKDTVRQDLKRHRGKGRPEGNDAGPPHQGMTIGKYTLQECIGRGSLGTVWRAEHPEFGIPVAVKILHGNAISGSEEENQRFLREARAAALLNHPHVIRVFDAGVDRGLKYLVMEFVPGGTVADLQEEMGGELPVKRAVELVCATVEALEAAAKLGIVHRDIKPENILLDQDGKPKLADLGLAKETVGDEQNSVTRTGQVMGTPFYIAPEQAIGSHEVDVRTDIYSLGATLYHLVTGKPPFDGPTLYEIFHGHLHEDLIDPRQRNPQVPAKLSRIICRMMEKNPANRYQTTAELRADLEGFMAQYSGEQPQLATPSFARRYALAIALAVLAVILLIVYWALPDRKADAPASTGTSAAGMLGGVPFRDGEWRIVDGEPGARGGEPRTLGKDEFSLVGGVLRLSGKGRKTRMLTYQAQPVMGPFKAKMELRGSNTIGIAGAPGVEGASCKIVLLDPSEAESATRTWHTVDFHRDRATLVCRVDGKPAFSLTGSHRAHGVLWILVPADGLCEIRSFEVLADEMARPRFPGGGRLPPPRP